MQLRPIHGVDRFGVVRAPGLGAAVEESLARRVDPRDVRAGACLGDEDVSAPVLIASTAAAVPPAAECVDIPSTPSLAPSPSAPALPLVVAPTTPNPLLDEPATPSLVLDWPSTPSEELENPPTPDAV